MIYKLSENRVFRSYIGGSRIDKLRGKESCTSGNFPEDWTASTVRGFNPGREETIEGLGKTVDGVFVKDLIKEDLPILVKLLDSDERLVIQVHPTKEFAKKFMNSEVGKAECWYFIDTSEDAYVYAGFKEGITEDHWRNLFEKQDIDSMLSNLHKIKVKKGDCIFIPGGLPHAIGEGCFMVELQEPSDLMVIPEKVTPSGRVLAESKLHCGLGFDKMFEVFDYVGRSEKETREYLMAKSESVTNNITKIIDKEVTGIFSMFKALGNSEFYTSSKYVVLVIVEGNPIINSIQYNKGDTLLVCEETKITFGGEDFEVVICE